eukprot:TRINITY_DN5396_c0_g1_i17.p2 TRINITY_DN5396_c0_g1~~TRINITY_DN5396_c0_g1_i17.p2  ORF type:complete len:194 (-),score=6.84 TRINITY_DN5396_c0_g1_i17:674-1255(-)
MGKFALACVQLHVVLVIVILELMEMEFVFVQMVVVVLLVNIVIIQLVQGVVLPNTPEHVSAIKDMMALLATNAQQITTDIQHANFVLRDQRVMDKAHAILQMVTVFAVVFYNHQIVQHVLRIIIHRLYADIALIQLVQIMELAQIRVFVIVHLIFLARIVLNVNPIDGVLIVTRALVAQLHVEDPIMGHVFKD